MPDSDPGWQPDEDRTVLRPAPASPPLADDESTQRTTYRPRPTPPLAGEGSVPPIARADHVPYPRDGSRFTVPESRFVAPPEPVRRERAAISVKAIVAWSLAMVLIGVAAGIGYVRFFRHTTDAADTVVPQSTTTQKVKVLRGDEVVRQYLNALAADDPATALSLAETSGTGSTKAITAQAYAQSLKLAPITAINVPDAAANATEIKASYKLGADDVSTTFKVAKQDNGSWLLTKATATFRPEGTGVDHLPLRVNGVAVDWDNPLELLPGVYRMSSGLSFVDYQSSDALTVPHLNYPETNPHQITPVLTLQGKQAFLQAAQQSLSLCLSRHELAPANCPMAMEGVSDLVPGSVRWTMDANPLIAANPALSATDQSRASVTVTLPLKVFVRFRNGGSSTTPATVNTTVSGLMTGSSSDSIRPEWRIN